MKINNLAIASLMLLIFGCGNNESEDPQLQGVFIDSPVENLTYEVKAGSYLTNSLGQFNYEKGETVTFSIGAITFPSVAAGDVITPQTLARAGAFGNNVTINIARLLMSLDIDGNPDNGITLPPDVGGVAYDQVDFDDDTTTFAQNQVIQDLTAFTGNPLVSTSLVQSHLNATNDRINTTTVSGAWRHVDDNSFQYMLLFDDNKFFYAEYDPNVESDTENGLEAGTYNYNSGSISFNLSYDDNDPGNDSGVGDIGTPVSIDASLINGNNQLSIAGGELTLNYVSFSTSPMVGAWSSTSGEAFQYLVLFSNKTFLYAENDPNAVRDEENGLEVGSYNYDSVSGIITFNISYDDNDPDMDSGIGDIGTPASYQVQLSNNNQTLSISGINLNRAL